MKAAAMAAPQKFEIVDKQIPEITSDQLLIRVIACGICMSEYPRWNEGRQTGEVFGHEPVGVVEKTGTNIKDFKKGDRVSGLFRHAFAEYTIANPALVIKLPDEVSDLEGILEPWSCLVSGAERILMDLGSSVALVGCGYMGLGFLQMMKLRGAGKIIAIDIREESLENARRFGADETYMSDAVPSKYIVDKWDDKIFARGVDVVVEAGGGATTLELAGKLVRPHGTLAVVGFHQSGGRREVDMHLWNWKAINVINAHERRSSVQMEYFARAIKLIQAKRLQSREMMTHEYSLVDINRAFWELKEKPPGYIKGYIRLSI
ncbi:MAG: zinc-binding dehydrogenase [Treponema sp.]|jgi:threonine dehydrogenase-like Zn-dependent dehydrogenase|nr:zinc-binding dehydrogenase [Treponema sp.]